MAAAIVNPPELARGRLVLVQEFGIGRIQRIGQYLRTRIAGGIGQVFQ